MVSARDPKRREVDEWWRFFGSIQPEPAIHVEDPIELRDLNIVLRRERLAQLKELTERPERQILLACQEEFRQALQLLEEGCSLEDFLSSACLSY